MNEQQQERLQMEAFAVRKNAHAPYSQFHVGCAVLDANGKIHVGCNVENAAFGSTICAERVALTSAIAKGNAAGTFLGLAVIGDTFKPIAPCGECRQVIAELCPADMPVLMGNLHGKWQQTTVGELLPGAFNRTALNREG